MLRNANRDLNPVVDHLVVRSIAQRERELAKALWPNLPTVDEYQVMQMSTKAAQESTSPEGGGGDPASGPAPSGQAAQSPTGNQGGSPEENPKQPEGGKTAAESPDGGQVLIKKEPSVKYGVYAARDGTVTETRWQDPNTPSKGLGYSVRISSDKDEKSGQDWYGHLDEKSVAVKPGDKVKRGDYLGSISLEKDKSGSAKEQYHVHLQRMETGKDGKLVDVDPGEPDGVMKGGRIKDKWGAIRKNTPKPHQGVDVFPARDGK